MGGEDTRRKEPPRRNDAEFKEEERKEMKKQKHAEQEFVILKPGWKTSSMVRTKCECGKLQGFTDTCFWTYNAEEKKTIIKYLSCARKEGVI